MVRASIVVDDRLIEECCAATGIKTRRALIDFALREILRRERQKDILSLKGKIAWEGDLDQLRKGRI